jgi:hypothetical protein
VRVGADNRSTAEKLCANLRAAGVIYCEVQRNRSSGRDARFTVRPPHRSGRAAFPHTAPTSGV